MRFPRSFCVLLSSVLALAGVAMPARSADIHTLSQALSAIPSGDGAPAGIFGFSVSIDGDMAVASDMGIPTRAGLVRTYVRSNGNWAHEAGHDIPIEGDSSAQLALRDGTLALTSYDSTTGRCFLQIHAHTESGWELQYGVSSTNFYYDSVATQGYIVVAGESSYDGATGQNQGRIRILRRDNANHWTSAQLTPTTPQAGARFGQAVSIVSGAIVVGAPRETVAGFADAGAAYIYELTIDTWNEVARIVEPGSGLTGNRFGSAVAISGADLGTPDRLLISSPSNTTNAHPGRVRSYTRTSGVWTARTVLQASPSTADDGWGCALALDNYWAAIGQCSSNAAATGAGAVEVVRFSPGFTSVDARSTGTDPQAGPNEYLGFRIDIDRSGPTLLVGNPAAPMYGNPAQGVVLFGAWQANALTLARGLDLGQGLTDARAAAVAADGDTVLVGAYQEDIGVQQDRGAVYVYRRVNGTYAYQSRILAPDGMAGDYFGLRIALKGDVALISSIGRTQGAVDAAGAVYAFHREGTVWSLEQQFLPVAPVYENELGESIAFDGTTAMISNRHDHTYVYERSSVGTWTPLQTIDHVGWPVKLEGDTAMLTDWSANGDVGEIAIYKRIGATWQPQGTLSGSIPGQSLGYDGSLRGDYYAASSNTAATPVQIYHRGANGWLPEASLLPEDATPDTYCWTTAMGSSSLAIGCNESGGPGAVYVFAKVAGLWSQQQKIMLDDPRDGDAFGFTLAFHADGTLYAGSLGRDLDFTNQGAVYVYTGDYLFANGFDQ
jgi:hypothetical protein